MGRSAGPTPVPESDRLNRLAVVALIVIGSVLRWSLISSSLWYDELWETRLYLGDAVNLLASLFTDDVLPFYHLLMFFWIHVFGDSEFSIRFLPLLAGIGSLALAYCIAVKAAGPRAGLLTLFFMSLCPAHIYYSTEARHYSLILFLCLALVGSIDRWAASVRFRAGWMVLYALLSLALYMSHFYLSVFVLAVSAAAFWYERRLRVPLAVIQVFSAAALMAYLMARAHLGDMSLFPPSNSYWYLRAFNFRETWMFFSNWILLGNSIWNMYGGPGWPQANLVTLQAVGLFVSLCGVHALFQGRSGAHGGLKMMLLAALLSVPVMLFVLQYAGFRQTYIERSALSSLPFFWMAVSIGLGRIRGPHFPVPLSQAVLAVAVFAFLSYTLSLSRAAEFAVLLFLLLLAFAGYKVRRYAGTALMVLAVGLQMYVTNLYFHKHQTMFTVTPPRPDWRSLTLFLTQDMGASVRQGLNCAVFVSPLSTPISYYNGIFADESYLLQRRAMQARVQNLADKLKYLLGEKTVREINEQIATFGQNDSRVILYGRAPEPGSLAAKGVRRIYLIQSNHDPRRAEVLNTAILAEGYVPSGAAHFGKAIRLYRYDPAK